MVVVARKGPANLEMARMQKAAESRVDIESVVPGEVAAVQPEAHRRQAAFQPLVQTLLVEAGHVQQRSKRGR